MKIQVENLKEVAQKIASSNIRYGREITRHNEKSEIFCNLSSQESRILLFSHLAWPHN